jgi:glycosyltransferase involved in cell wall biosynthesis
MRIAQVCHLWESVPPRQYGGTERVVAHLTEELTRLGHEVTLFASGDSVTSARLSAVSPLAVRLYEGPLARDAFLALLQEKVLAQADQFDLTHSHLDFVGFPMARRCPTPVVTTLHGRLDLPELQPVYRLFDEQVLISISDSQRRGWPYGNWHATVHHGLPRDLYRCQSAPGRYLAFLGRMSPEKRPDAAIRLAIQVGLPLRMAAKIDPVDRDYFASVIRPRLNHPLIEYVGEISDAQKQQFLGEAIATLCPYEPEPFGLVLIESLACGTPVIAYRHGSFEEIIVDGVTGFLCKDEREMVTAVGEIGTLDRHQCRDDFERRFTATRMAHQYLAAYHGMLDRCDQLSRNSRLHA